MRVLLYLPDGVSVRNFVLTGVANLWQEDMEVDVLVKRGLPARVLGLLDEDTHIEEEIAYPEAPAEAIVRRTLEYAHLRYIDTPGARRNVRMPIPGRLRSRVIRGLSREASRFLSSEGWIRRLESMHIRLASRRSEVDNYESMLREREIDLVVSAHQRPLSNIPIVLAARRLGIQTTVFIFSWDNLSTKGRIAAPFDDYLVWSDLMAHELQRYYPTIQGDHIHVVGSPQFEPYADESLHVSRATFCAELGLDPQRPIICYSGGDTGTCPEDQLHFEILCGLLEAGQVRGDPQVVLRPAPVDTSGRYNNVLRRYPVAVAWPDWHDCGSGWSSLVPDRSDLQRLVNLTVHSDVNVNVASTMTLDFALHDTPVVNIGFDVDARRDLVPHYYDFDHYVPVVKLGAAQVAASPDALAGCINTVLEDPSYGRDARQNFAELELGRPAGGSGIAMREALMRVCEANG